MLILFLVSVWSACSLVLKEIIIITIIITEIFPFFRFFSGSSVIKNILFNLKLICSISTRSVLYSFNRLRRCGYQSPNYIKIFILPRKIHLFHHFSTKNSYLFHQLDRVNSHLFRLSDYKTATYSVYKRTFLSQWVSFCLFTLVKRLKRESATDSHAETQITRI